MNPEATQYQTIEVAINNPDNVDTVTRLLRRDCRLETELAGARPREDGQEGYIVTLRTKGVTEALVRQVEHTLGLPICREYVGEDERQAAVKRLEKMLPAA